MSKRQSWTPPTRRGRHKRSLLKKLLDHYIFLENRVTGISSVGKGALATEITATVAGLLRNILS